MKKQIQVTQRGDGAYVVRVVDSRGATEHHVTVPDRLLELTNDASGEELVRESFRFLLERVKG